MSGAKGITRIDLSIKPGPLLPQASGWIPVAFDMRSRHYWHIRDGRWVTCGVCGLVMTDWSVINKCGVVLPA